MDYINCLSENKEAFGLCSDEMELRKVATDESTKIVFMDEISGGLEI